uniref:Uncharacterized protein n=1 Tax=Rhizophora mucronata TaxID=61149 RepID=A0A2P2Q8W4_RHIMU
MLARPHQSHFLYRTRLWIRITGSTAAPPPLQWIGESIIHLAADSCAIPACTVARILNAAAKDTTPMGTAVL